MADSTDSFEAHIPITHDDLTAVDALSAETRLSRQVIKQAMNKGAVWLGRAKHTQRIRRASKTLKAGDALHLYYNPAVLAMQTDSAQLIADEGKYSIWYKPSGMLSQGSKWGDHCTVGRWAEQHSQPQRPAFVVHRLDRAASGLVLIAHAKKVAAALSKLFQDRQIEKHYAAIVQGHFPASPEVKTFNSDIDDRPAITHVHAVSYNSERDCTLLDVIIETGRKHQIRKHLSRSGFPIIGDRLYNPAEHHDEDLQLCAVSLSFACPLTGLSRLYELDTNLSPTLQQMSSR